MPQHTPLITVIPRDDGESQTAREGYAVSVQKDRLGNRLGQTIRQLLRPFHMMDFGKHQTKFVAAESGYRILRP